MKQKKTKKLDFEKADDIHRSIVEILSVIEMDYVDPKKIYCYRSYGSTSRSYARIWSFPKIFQDALNIEPAYVIEVLSHHFDKLSEDEKKKVLIHELLHIPKNFSGALLPHRTRSRSIGTLANQLFKQYKAKKI